MEVASTGIFMLSILAIAFILPVGSYGDDDVYVQDSYGNVVFRDRTVSYVRPVPVGNATYITNLDYDAKGLDLLYDAARSFVQDVQSNSFPFDILEKAANNQFDLATDSKKLIEHFSGLTACFVIGVVAVAVFIISGIFFCCCRGCCGNCGGDETQVFTRNEGCLRMGLSQALFIMSLCVLSAGVCVYITNDRFTDAIDFSNKSVTTNIEDVDRYLKNTGVQFKYVVTDMYEIIHTALMKDLDEMGNLTALFIRQDLGIDRLLEELYTLDNYLKNTSLLLAATELAISDLQSIDANLIERLGTLADEIEATQASCSGACVPNLCFDVMADDIRHGGNNHTNELPNLNATRTKVDDFNSTTFSDAAIEVINDLEAVALKVDGLSGDIKRAVRGLFNGYRSRINSLSIGVFNTMTKSFPADDMKKQTSDIFETAAKYDKYRLWFGLALTSLIVVVMVFILLAIFIGTCWDDVTVLPTERKSMSNFGGNLLLFAVGVLFLIGALLTLLASVAFLLGGLLEKSCEPMEDLTLFKDFLDQDKVSGFSMSQAILGVTTVRLNSYDVLMSCRADQTPWVAFKMGEVVPLEEYIKYLKYVGDAGQILQGISNIDLDTYKVLTKTLQTSLDDLQAAGLDSIDFQLINEATEIPTLSFSVDDTTRTMENIASNCNSPGTKERWFGHIDDLDRLQDTTGAEEDNIKIQLSVSSSNLQTNLEHVKNLSVSIHNIALEADERISKNMTGVLLKASVGLLGNILSMLESYATEVTYMIYNELANCIPVWNLYKSATVVLCDYGVDTLNGYWFSIGWGVLFFFPMIIIGAKLSKHYKIMDTAVGYKSYHNFMAEESLGTSALPDATDGYEVTKF